MPKNTYTDQFKARPRANEKRIPLGQCGFHASKDQEPLTRASTVSQVERKSVPASPGCA